MVLTSKILPEDPYVRLDSVLSMLSMKRHKRYTPKRIQEAWEALATASVIPVSWAEGGLKLQCRACEGRGHPLVWGWTQNRCKTCEGRGYRTLPRSMSQLVSLALDPWGMLRAEALALELASRLRPWGVPATTRVDWCVVHARWALRRMWYPALLASAWEAALADWLATKTVTSGIPHIDQVLGLRPADLWPRWFPKHPNPHEPEEALIDMGYGLVCEPDYTVTLACRSRLLRETAHPVDIQDPVPR